MTTVSDGSKVVYPSEISPLKMQAIRSYSLKSLVREANQLDIQKENIVGLLKEGEAFVLVFYGKPGL